MTPCEYLTCGTDVRSNGWAWCDYCYSKRRGWIDDGDHSPGVYVCPNCRHADMLVWRCDVCR